MFAFAVGAVFAMPRRPTPGEPVGAKATLASAFAFAASLALPPFAGSLPALAAAAFVAGAANGVMDVTMNAHATSLERRWGAAIMSSFHAAFSAGGLLGAALGGALGGGGAAWILGAGALLAAALTLLAARTLQGADAAPAPVETGLALPARAALPICLAAFLCYMCEGAMGDWSAVYLRAFAAAPQNLAPAGYAAFSAMMVIGRASGDAVVRAWGRTRVVAAGGALAGVGFTLAVATPALLPASLGFALVGLGLSNVVPALFSAAGRLAASPAAGVAMAATAGYAGLLGGPVVIGAVAELTGLRVALGLLVVLAAAIALAAKSLERR